MQLGLNGEHKRDHKLSMPMLSKAKRVLCRDNWAWLRQAIMLVENAAGDAALLGRPRSLRGRGAVLTCLSGFIEQVRVRMCRIYCRSRASLHGRCKGSPSCCLCAAEC